MASTSTNRRQGVNTGAAVKVPCKASTTANITLSGEQTIDGVSCVDGDRVLVQDQNTGSENGIYVVSTSSWQRDKDFDGTFDVVQGTLIPVSNGTVNGGQIFRVTTANPITIGTTSLAFDFALSSSTMAYTPTTGALAGIATTVSAFLNKLGDAGTALGAALIGFVQSGTGLSATTLQAHGRKHEFVDTIDDLKAWSGPTQEVTVFVRGYGTPGDGGGGMYRWNSTDTDTDNSATTATIVQASGITTGRWNRYKTPQLRRDIIRNGPRLLMASPPTITAGSAGGSTVISDEVAVAKDDAAFRYLGNTAGVGASFPQTLYYAPDNIYYLASINTIFATGPWAVEFMFDGSEFEWKTTGNAGKYRLIVDDELVTAAAQSGPSATGSEYLIHVAFASRAVRKIRLELTSNSRFGGLNVGPNDTVWTPFTPALPTAVMLGDSFTEGTGADSTLDCLALQLGHYLGWNVHASGLGATGYLNPGSGSKVKFADRLTKDVYNRNPDIVFIAGGINDHASYTEAAIQAEALSVFNAIRTNLPHARIYTMGPFWSNGSPTSSVTDARDAIEAAAASAGVQFIDNIDEEWITGSGRVGSTTGSGNADYYTGTDNTHPSQAGHNYYAYRLATAIASFWQD
jgi:lysophospholipase L1-like esterase